MNAPLTPEWLKALSLAERSAPEFFRAGEVIRDRPHAAAMRQAIDEIGVSAIHCIQGVPTIAFVVLEEEDRDRIDRIHADLWNQGLMSLLLVIVGDELLAYTLTRKPIEPERLVEPQLASDQRRLDTFNLLEHALVLRDFVSGIESGRLFREEHYPSLLDAAQRVDGVLLANLMATQKRLLQTGLPPDAAQALLMQAMFIAYLEDRGVITGDYFREATGQQNIDGLRPLLRARRPDWLHRLFLPLHDDFNGDLFHSPCAFGGEPAACDLLPEHLAVLDEFIWGDTEMATGQRRFWTYHFRYIPVELVSAVYDRMLAEDADRKKADGAYYTPMFLADLVVDQAWEFLDEKQRHAPEILDPACGSGVFLVRMFERVVEHRRAKSGGKLPWQTLKALVHRLHGWDKNPMAVRIAAFSIYLALLEQRDPREIRQLMAEGKMLPTLWGNTLKAVDFFSQAGERQFDLVIGNPPWNSRKNKLQEAIAWCEAHGYPIPQEQSAWGFVWKAREHAKEEGLISFLVPAMGFLHNDASLPARNRWFNETRVEQLINFADLRHLLFDGAKAACLLAIFRPRAASAGDYRFEYWCPKSDLNIQARRSLSLARIDRNIVSLKSVLLEPEIFKQRLWMAGREILLHDYLSSFRRLKDFITSFKDAKRNNGELGNKWIIGQGFAAAREDRLDEPGYARDCPLVARIPFLDAPAFRPWVLPLIETAPWNTTGKVHRERFSLGFQGPHILIPKMIRNDGRIRASYGDQDLSFFHSIQAVKFPKDGATQAKVLTAVFNSKIAGWFLFHDTGSVGIEIPEIHEDELLQIPFPSPDDLDVPADAQAVFAEIVSIMDDLLQRRRRVLDEDHWPETIRRLDELVFAYFGLSEEEITIIQETFDEIIPAIQPNKGKRPKLWNNSSTQDETRYLRQLESSLAAWMQPGVELHARVLANSMDAAIVHVHLGEMPGETPANEDWNAALNRIWPHLDRPVSRNLQVITDLHVFDGDDLYLFKPRKRRFWLRTTAMNDAAAIAGELLIQPEE